MRTQRAPGALLLGPALVAALLVAGCGVKNDPVAPQSGRTPQVTNPAGPVAANDVAGGRSALNPAARNEESVFAETGRIQASDNDGNDDTNVIAPAEVSRNSQAAGRSFILDPLLN